MLIFKRRGFPKHCGFVCYVEMQKYSKYGIILFSVDTTKSFLVAEIKGGALLIIQNMKFYYSVLILQNLFWCTMFPHHVPPSAKARHVIEGSSLKV